MPDPLTSLLVDADEIDRDRLAQCLSGRIAVDGESGSLVFLPGFESLSSAKTKVLVCLLGRKAAVLLGRRGDEALGRSALAEASGIPDGTVGRVVRELAAERFVSQDEQKRYFVPSHQLTRAHEILTKGQR